jgi:hypothetical protein
MGATFGEYMPFGNAVNISVNIVNGTKAFQTIDLSTSCTSYYKSTLGLTGISAANSSGGDDHIAKAKNVRPSGSLKSIPLFIPVSRGILSGVFYNVGKPNRSSINGHW